MFIRTRLAGWLTFGFAAGITLFPFIFISPKVPLTRRLVVHERIHLQQQLELLVVPFFLLYLTEYFLNLLKFKNHFQAYYNISFEREAYSNDRDSFYLRKRRFFNWHRYL